MLDSKVIESIVKEVLSKINIDRQNTKQKLLVIKPDLDFEHEIRLLEPYWNVVEADRQKVLTFSDLNQAVFLHVDQDTLVRVALGLTDTPESKLFPQLVTHELPITFVLENSLQELLQIDEQNHKYSFYIRKIRSYKETVEKYGVTFKRIEELRPQEVENSNKNNKHKNSSLNLISQEDIMNFSGNLLVVQPGTIITPLAKDKARERGIHISFS